MKNKYKSIARILLLLLIAATLVFIFLQSTKPPQKSQAESDKVGEIVGEIIPPGTPAGDYVQENIRKIAHFTEFFFLGCEVSLYVILFLPRIKWAALSFPTALIVAFFDESIQIFSNRGPSVKDVWIDFFGFAFASACFYTVAAIVIFIYGKCKQK